jgi:hypothetical protein
MEPRNRTQREPQSLEAWESWVDKLIVDAQERGDFDDLPGHGKPLRIEDAPFAGGLEVGFGILKNAGVAPFWVELEKEMRAAGARLDEIAERAARVASTLPSAVSQAPVSESPARRGWWPFRRAASSPVASRPVAVRPDPRSAEIDRLRRDYLEQAEQLDRLVAQYNAAIPRDLWHLERPRLPRNAAEQAFEERVGQSGSAVNRS